MTIGLCRRGRHRLMRRLFVFLEKDLESRSQFHNSERFVRTAEVVVTFDDHGGLYEFMGRMIDDVGMKKIQIVLFDLRSSQSCRPAARDLTKSVEKFVETPRWMSLAVAFDEAAAGMSFAENESQGSGVAQI